MTLFGIKASQNQNVVASGGTITDAGGFRRHQFNTSSTFTVSVGGPIEVAVIGGGAFGQGTFHGGGGGGGALRTMNIPAGSYSFTVGGVAGTSTFSHLGFTLTATGGTAPTRGVGSGGETNFNGGNGGSGTDGAGNAAPGGSGFTIWGTGYAGGGGVGAGAVVAGLQYRNGGPGGFGGGGKGGDAFSDGGYVLVIQNGSPGSQRGAGGGGAGIVFTVASGADGSGIGGTVMFRYPI